MFDIDIDVERIHRRDRKSCIDGLGYVKRSTPVEVNEMNRVDSDCCPN